MSNSYGINWEEIDEWRQTADMHYWESTFDGTYEKENKQLLKLAKEAYLNHQSFDPIQHLQSELV